jgi:hypothetical protein
MTEVLAQAAVPLVSDKNRDISQYGNLPALFERARFCQFWPLEAEGDLVTFDQVQEEYQRFLTA